MTLAEFLLARIAEDDAAARAATAGERPWRYDEKYHCVWDGTGTAAASHGRPADLAHIARHDPARVLADCAAHRRIVELYRQSVTDLEVAKGNNLGGVVSDPLEIAEFAGIQMGLEWAVQALAAPFSDHPDFRAEWAS